MTRATYTITDPVLPVHGAPVRCVESPLTGITWATYRNGKQFALGVPLCSGCDEIVNDEPCACESKAMPEEMARFYAAWPEMGAMYSSEARRKEAA